MNWGTLVDYLEATAAKLETEIPDEWRAATKQQEFERITQSERSEESEIRSAIRALLAADELPTRPVLKLLLRFRIQSAIGFCQYCWMKPVEFPKASRPEIVATLLEAHWNRTGRQQWQTQLREVLGLSDEEPPA